MAVNQSKVGVLVNMDRELKAKLEEIDEYRYELDDLTEDEFDDIQGLLDDLEDDFEICFIEIEEF